ncbi:hypothetical protein SANA_21460 [Gottschalkiaceae bacterium SANA]|nr:hypothetical protein SANA_21460 [Gottschalkiaceae bacterium SANA]
MANDESSTRDFKDSTDKGCLTYALFDLGKGSGVRTKTRDLFDKITRPVKIVHFFIDRVHIKKAIVTCARYECSSYVIACSLPIE